MTKKNDDDMIGFKEFIEMDEKKKSEPKKRVSTDNYEIVNFLEKDAKRLTHQIDLFEEKTFMLKSFPQGENLLTNLNAKVSHREDEIIQKLNNEQSPLCQNLEDILTVHFDH